ncbi:hypothetical protein BDD12DRAFT_911255 [Trichophaea hybrida]|nr:hypothetical protein BDD12DRAFT_911255 [Trichophaea hybrida]
MGSSMKTDFTTTSDISLGSPTTSDFISTCYTDSSTDSDDFVFKFPKQKPRTPSPTDSEIFSRYTTLNSSPIKTANEGQCNCPRHEEVPCAGPKLTYYLEAHQAENQPTNTHSSFDSTSSPIFNFSLDDTINPASLSKPFLNSSIDAILIPSTPTAERPTTPSIFKPTSKMYSKPPPPTPTVVPIPPAERPTAPSIFKPTSSEPPPPTATVFPIPIIYGNIDGPSKEIKQFWWCCMCSMVWEYEVGEWDGERCPGMECQHQRCTRCGWTRRSYYNH